MPVGHTWNLSEWMRYLGIHRKDQPDVTHLIQPVTIVGDHSALAAPLLAPTAVAGATRAAVAGTHPAMQLTCRAAGGTAVRTIYVYNLTGTSALNRVRLSNTPGTLANVVTPTPLNQGADNVLSLFRIGTLAAEPGTPAELPAIKTGAMTADILVPFPIFVPPGQTLEVWGSVVNQAIHWSIEFDEFPAQLGPR